MHLYFIDDSGTITPQSKMTQHYFVLGGLVVPEGRWRYLERTFFEICRTYNIRGEIKWRFFGQKPGREDKNNTLSHLSTPERDALRNTFLSALANDRSIKLIARVTHLPTIYSSLPGITSEEVHAMAYTDLISAYQSYLHRLSQVMHTTVNGIIISDHRNPLQDTALRNLHMEMLKSDQAETPKFPNLLEGLFFAPSHHSIGIQFADLVSGAVFRYYEHGDDRWYNLILEQFWNPSIQQDETLAQIMGDGKEKDAESMEPLGPTEPTYLTQSQRNPDYSSE